MESEFIDTGNEIKIIVKHLSPGTRLIYNAYDEDGNLIHHARVPFTLKKIYEILNSGIESLYYNKPVIGGKYQYCDNIEAYLKNKVYKGPRQISIETQLNAVKAMDNIIQTIKNKEVLDLDEARCLVDTILYDMETSDEEIINLLAIQDYDDLTYTHSLNVGLIALSLAIKMGFKEEQVINIGIGGFLHDIGKIEIPYEIINKLDKLTYEEHDIVKKHPALGYEMVKNDPKISSEVKEMILFHHERYNGTGYPFGLKGDQLNDSFSIVAIAEVYDMMTEEQTYRKIYSPKEAFAYIAKEAGKQFNPHIAHRFVSGMRNTLLKESHYYSIGSYVLLDTHEVARVLSKDSELTSRPVIEIMINQHGKILIYPIYVDLKLEGGSRNIIKILDEQKLKELLKFS